MDDDDPDMPALSPDDEPAPAGGPGPATEKVARPVSRARTIAIVAGTLVVLIVAVIVARTALKADDKPATASTKPAPTMEKKDDADSAKPDASKSSSETGLPAWYLREVTPWAAAFTTTVNNHDALLNGDAKGAVGLIKQFEAVKAENAALKGELATMKSRVDALEGRIPSPVTSP